MLNYRSGLVPSSVGGAGALDYNFHTIIHNHLPLLFQCSDTAYTNFHLDSHTDGNYFSEAPGPYTNSEASLLF